MKWFANAMSFTLWTMLPQWFGLSAPWLVYLGFLGFGLGIVGLVLDFAQADRQKVLERRGWIGVFRWQFGLASEADYQPGSRWQVRLSLSFLVLTVAVTVSAVLFHVAQR